jgi:hypothetical protein
MNLSVIIMIIIGVFAFLAFGFIIMAVLISKDNLKENKTSSGITIPNNYNIIALNDIDESFFTDKGPTPLAPAPSFNRISPKSTALQSLSSVNPLFTAINHTIQKFYRIRSLKDIVSPNHWLGSTMYEQKSTGENFFSVYPYIASIRDDNFIFSWSCKGFIQRVNNNVTPRNINSCHFNSQSTDTILQNGNSDIQYNVEDGYGLKIGSSNAKSLSCDIVDVDALVGTVIWQYKHVTYEEIGSITIPLVQGSPYITIEANNIEITIECDHTFYIESLILQPQSVQNNSLSKSYQNDMIYAIRTGEGTGFLIFLSKPAIITIQSELIIIPRMTGVIRISYFESIDMLNILSKYYDIYPIESTIDCKATAADEKDFESAYWNTETSFIWTTKNMFNRRKSEIDENHDNNLLMVALPHHNINNAKYESSPINHPVIGPYRFVVTNDNTWSLIDTVTNYQFKYPLLKESNNMLHVWKDEIKIVSSLKPQNIIDWMKWLGSLSILILMGDMLKQDINIHKKLLEEQLDSIRVRNGNMSQNKTFVYDKTWGGVISSTGLDDPDNRNYLYESHIGRYGYLVFAYAVAGYFNLDFLNKNKETALYFVRDISNPYQSDNNFPLWRNKNWYLGYSVSSGLISDKIGKDTSNIGETVAGYYGVYLISRVLKLDTLSNWSLSLLASEITSLQYYFQFSSYNAITVDSAFTMGTITNRGDNYYSYKLRESSDKNQKLNSCKISMALALVSMIKPLNLMSFEYINNDWSTNIQSHVLEAFTENIQPESLSHAIVILAMGNNEEIKQQAIDIISDNHNIVLPYGSTWSSVLYWILQQT